MLHGWAGYRIGAHQMFTKLAKRAEAEGFECLRFDFRGRGDSEGDASAATLTTMISDAQVAVDWLCEHGGVERVALVGDCSGAEVAIGAGVLRESVSDMVLWSAPIVGADRTGTDKAKKWHIIRQYLGKLFKPQTYQKLFAGQLDKKMIKKALKSGGKGAGEQGSEDDAEIDWLRRFVEFAGEVLFIYGGNDPTAQEAISHYEHLSAEAGRDFQQHVVRGANHAFYSVRWENEVIETTVQWLLGRSEQSLLQQGECGASEATAVPGS
jgi:pimeloyl-ACP methyl ester carboxylesterase